MTANSSTEPSGSRQDLDGSLTRLGKPLQPLDDVSTVGGSRDSTSTVRGARVRAMLCVADRREMGDALTAAGYDVTWVRDLSEVVGCADAEAFDVLVFDGEAGGWLRSISDLRRGRSKPYVVMIGDPGNPEEFLAAVGAGVDGFCPADAPVEAMLRTVRSVEQSGVAIPRSMVQPLVEHVRHGRGFTVHTAAGPVEVTAREWEILQGLMQRRDTKEIAEELFVSVGTVRSHISTLLKKIGAVDREDAVRLVERGSRGA